MKFRLESEFEPAGDQPEAIKALVDGLNAERREQVLMGVTGILMTIIAILFLRNQLRPIKRLATAAEAFGKGRVIGYSPSGAAEVRAAGGAFLSMRSRIPSMGTVRKKQA